MREGDLKGAPVRSLDTLYALCSTPTKLIFINFAQ